MSLYPGHRSSVGCILIALLIVNVGCRGWIEKPIVPDTGRVMPQRGLLRVTMTDGATITLRDVVVSSDSIVGFYADAPTMREAVARTDVMKIELRVDTTPRWARFSLVYETVVLITGSAALGGAYGFPFP